MTDTVISTSFAEVYADAIAYARGIGLKATPWSNTVMIHEALRRGVEVEKARRGNGMVLRHGGRAHRFRGGNHSLNTRLANRATRYKEITRRLLLNAGVATPENVVFGPNDEDRAWAWGESLTPLVIKPHDAMMGRHVFVAIENKSHFSEAFQTVASARGAVLVEQFRTGREHRCLVVDDQIVAVTRRRAASVLGDGRSTVAELVAAKNQYRGPIHKEIRLGPEAVRELQRQGLELDHTPPEGVRVYVRATSNLHTGGDAIDATDEITAGEREMVVAASRAIPGLRAAGFDALLPRSAGDDPLAVLEVNHNPMISMHHFPWSGKSRDAAGAIMDAMFPATRATTR